VIDNPPLFDLLQRAEAAETGIVIVEAAVSDARRLSGAVGITHLRRAPWREFRIWSHGRGENRGIHHRGGDVAQGTSRIGHAGTANHERLGDRPPLRKSTESLSRVL